MRVSFNRREKPLLSWWVSLEFYEKKARVGTSGLWAKNPSQNPPFWAKRSIAKSVTATRKIRRNSTQLRRALYTQTTLPYYKHYGVVIYYHRSNSLFVGRFPVNFPRRTRCFSDVAVVFYYRNSVMLPLYSELL